MTLFSYTLSTLSGYIGEFEIIDDHRAGKIVVNLTGRLNKVRNIEWVLSGCFDVTLVVLAYTIPPLRHYVLQPCFVNVRLHCIRKRNGHLRILMQ